MAELLERWTQRRPRVHVPLWPLAGFVLSSPEFKSSATFFINTIIIIMTCSFPLIPLRELCVLKKKKKKKRRKRRKRRRRRRSRRRRRRRRSSSSSTSSGSSSRRRRRRRTGEGGETNPEIAQSNGSASRYWYIWDYVLRYRIVVSWDWRHQSSKTITASVPLGTARILRSLDTWGPFLEGPGDFTGQKTNFKVKHCWILISTVLSSQTSQFCFVNW